MDLYIHDYVGHVGQLEVARALAERGHRVVFSYCDQFCTPRADLAAGDSQQGLRIEPISIGQSINKKNHFARQWQDGRYARALVRHIRQFGPNVAISANTPLIPQRSLARHLAKRRIPLVHWWTDVYSLAVKHGVGGKYGPLGDAIAAWYTRLETRLLDGSQAIVAIAPQFQPIADQWGVATPLTVIPVAAPTRQVLPGPKANDWARRHGVAETRNVLYCGTLGNKHNPHLLLALAEATADQADVRVIVASEGAGADWLLQRRLPNLVLLPFQSFEDYPQALAAGDVHTSVLNKEAAAYALPSKVMSQMCAARPQVAAAPAVNYASKLISKSEAGVVCSPDSPSDFCRVVIELLNDEHQCVQLGANARSYVEQTLSLERLTPQYEELFQRLTSDTFAEASVAVLSG